MSAVKHAPAAPAASGRAAAASPDVALPAGMLIPLN